MNNIETYSGIMAFIGGFLYSCALEGALYTDGCKLTLYMVDNYHKTTGSISVINGEFVVDGPVTVEENKAEVECE